MRIRVARDDDLEAVAACARAAYGKYVARIGREPAPMVADFATQIAEGRVHVAVDASDSVVGYVVFYPRDGSIHLENVAVAPEAQGTGCGRMLVGFVESRARAMGLATVDLYTNAKMTENLSLYPRLGYEETGRRTEDGFSRVYFRKALGENG